MARSLNKAQVIGRLGRDPEVRRFSNGGSVVSFPVATSETWKDRSTGEARERTEWHRVAIYNEALGRLAMSYLKKGDQVYLEGKMETRKWQDQGGQDRFTTEIALRPYAGEMTFLGSGARGNDGNTRRPPDAQQSAPPRTAASPTDAADIYSGARGYGADFGGMSHHGGIQDDDIPF